MILSVLTVVFLLRNCAVNAFSPYKYDLLLSKSMAIHAKAKTPPSVDSPRPKAANKKKASAAAKIALPIEDYILTDKEMEEMSAAIDAEDRRLEERAIIPAIPPEELERQRLIQEEADRKSRILEEARRIVAADTEGLELVKVMAEYIREWGPFEMNAIRVLKEKKRLRLEAERGVSVEDYLKDMAEPPVVLKTRGRKKSVVAEETSDDADEVPDAAEEEDEAGISDDLKGFYGKILADIPNYKIATGKRPPSTYLMFCSLAKPHIAILRLDIDGSASSVVKELVRIWKEVPRYVKEAIEKRYELAKADYADFLDVHQEKEYSEGDDDDSAEESEE